MKATITTDVSVTTVAGMFWVAMLLSEIALAVPKLEVFSMFAYPLVWVILLLVLALEKTEKNRKKQVLTTSINVFAVALILAHLVHWLTKNAILGLSIYANAWLILVLILALGAKGSQPVEA